MEIGCRIARPNPKELFHFSDRAALPQYWRSPILGWMGRGKRQDYFNKINYLKKRLIGEVKAKMGFYENIVESIFLILGFT